MDNNNKLFERTGDVVTAYISNNNLPHADLPALIKSVYATLAQTAVSIVAPVAEPQTPSVSIKKSITPDFLICLEDGRRFKSLKRHLHSKYGMTPEAYRAKWNLPKDYPMVAPAYSASRSALAKSMKLGVKGNQKRTRKKA